jgi:succinoglycan biosynthesis transport protein ExoP
MLQNSNARGQQQTSRVLEVLSAAEFYAAGMGFLRRRFRVIAVMMLLGLSLGAAYVFTTPSRYAARAILIVDTPKTQFFQLQSQLGGSPIDSATVDTQIEILNSEDIALSVIRDLHLDTDPELTATSAGVLGAVLKLADGMAPAAVKAVFPAMSKTADEPPAEDRALRAFQRQLKVKRVAVTYAIEIDFESGNPYRAAQISNAVADAYAIDAFKAKFQITDRAAKWLQDRLAELREQASNSERAVVDYKTSNNIVDTGGRLMNEQQLAELNSELIQARASTTEAKARLDRVEQIIAFNDVDPDATATATVADTLHNEVVSKMRTQYLDDERRASLLAAKVGAKHLAVVGLHKDMLELRRTISEELKRTAEGYKSDYAIAESREDSIQQSLDRIVAASHATDKAQITLHNLESIAQTYREMYDSFLQRYTESVQQQSSPVAESRLITHARPPLSESSPRPLLVTALAALGGLIFGTAIGMLRDISDRVFRTTTQVGEHLRTNCIAVIPLIKDIAGRVASFEMAKLPQNADAEEPLLPFGGLQGAASSPRMAGFSLRQRLDAIKDIGGTSRDISDRAFRARTLDGPYLPPSQGRQAGARRRYAVRRDKNVCWTVANSPLSRFTESIRALKLAADGGNIVKYGKIIGVTSSLPNEGKSTIAISLATLIAHGGGRAILIDCDLRNPELSRMITPDAEAGLLEIIAGRAALEDVLWREPATELTLLPAVLTSRLAHSSNVLASQGMRDLFALLRASYDYVILDLSPLAPVVDVRVMAPLVDSFLFVVEWGRTDIEIVKLALSDAPEIYDNLLGIVLNKVDMKAFGRYANYRENYYNNPRYSRYGYAD